MNEAFYRLAVKEGLVLYKNMIHILRKRKKSTEIEIISKGRQGGVQWNIPCYRVQDRCDKNIVMSSVVENFGLHPLTREKREKRDFKNRIPLRELSDWKVFIVGYMLMESKIRVLLCHHRFGCRKFWFTFAYTRKTGKRRFQKSDFTPESFQIEKCLS